MALGEIFLSAFLQALFQQLTTSATMALASYEKVESHFRKLSHSLSIVRGVLDDAEEKQLTENSVKAWLEILRDLAYDLDDVLDEITTRALIRASKGGTQQQGKSSLARRLIPTCSRYTPNALIANYRMMSRIKDISKRLQDTVSRRIDLKLTENHHGASHNRHLITRLPTTSLNESHVYGRDEDRDALIRMLLGDGESSDGDDVQVIPIVGMGGIGKTTLAQLVYNDREVRQSFHRRAWICVDVVFDVQNITKTILESVIETSVGITDLNSLQVRLQQELSKTKFLIVLDDLWNKNYEQWDRLCRPFHSGLPGSRIIVTTRDDSIASVVGSPRKAYHMKLLTDEDCLRLLAQHSRQDLDERSGFRDVGLGLVKKCKGLPLAAKTLGGLLRAKESKEGWEIVLRSKIWDLPEEENNILPVLRLSYYHLPSHLKHLFAYCSIFPKDYEFDPNELVQLWMAEGFLEQPDGKPSERNRKEELGLEYFKELMLRSFFQRSSESGSAFVMHDLINDLAQFVAAGTCYRLDEKMDTNLEYQVPPKTRHGSFLRHEYEVYRKFKGFGRVRGLRTFLPMPIQNSLVWPPFYMSNTILVELVPELLRLRVLSLSGYSITEVPVAVCGLIHIRYLNLSGTLIVELPDSVGDLLRLETLLLSNCRHIRKLPSTLGNLSNLRHLDNSNTDELKDMPVEIGKLKDLQTLPKIVLSKNGNGLGLKELRHLKLLRGTVALLELQNVTDTEDVKEANLRDKDELDELQLTWGNDDVSGNNARCSQEDVMDRLRPHENLKSLKVESYRGSQFPGWIGDPLFGNLSSVSIDDCSACKDLPPFGQLPELKTLRIQRMSNVQRVGKEFYGNGLVCPPFPKLETLRFNHMPKWEKWSAFQSEDSLIQFPCLQNLAMFKCDRLTRVSPLSFPRLRGLDLEDCNKVVLESFRNLDSLSFLKVESVSGLSHLPTDLTKLKALEILECCNCKDMESIWSDVSLENLNRLKRIVIADCSQLVTLGQGEQQFPSNLEVMELYGCPNLTTLPSDLSNLSLLRELIIKNCMKFSNFPETGIPGTLKRLEILSCNALISLPNNILNLERLEIKDCSSLRTWGGNNFPVSLKKLSVKNCAILDPVQQTMFPETQPAVSLEDLSLCDWPNFNNLVNKLNGFSYLVELNLSGCSGLRHIPEQGLPPNLRALSIEYCAHLKSLPARIQTMSSLLSLEIRSCSKLNNFPQCDLPQYLTYLRIWDSKNFKPLKQWGLHRLTSLREFSICGGFKELELLGDEELFSPSVEKFSIARFPKLTSLGKVLENLESLRHLSIMNCAALDTLPSERLLGRLWHLEISGCTLLSPKCAKDRGDHWGKIAGIPCVEIDGTYVYKQNLV